MVQSALTEDRVAKQLELVALVRKWGDINAGGLLEESCQTFFIPSVEGFIGYKIEHSHAVVFGDPVCSRENKAVLAKAFQEDCRLKNLGIIYTIASEEFASWALHNLSASIIEFGKKCVLDPFKNELNGKGRHAVLLRNKVKHAIKEGIIVHEYTENNPGIEQKITDIAAGWLQRRKGPQIYIAHISLFEHRIGKRWFYAEQNGQIVGALVLSEMQEKKGWLLNHVMTVLNAPDGISEFLITSVLEVLKKENCRYFLAGPIPAKQLGKIDGVNKSIAFLARSAFQCAKWIFHLDGYARYWNKFEPKGEGAYLVFPENNLRYGSVKALLAAYNVSFF